MVAFIIDGKKISSDIKAEVTLEVVTLKEQGIEPCLAVALVGDDPASVTYFDRKAEGCKEAGIIIVKEELPAFTTQGELVSLLKDWGRDDAINGKVVEFPLPNHIDPEVVKKAINPSKDVDGLRDDSPYDPCTAQGIMELLRRYNIVLKGMLAVVAGRGPTVGKPTARLLEEAGATVLTCHRYTKDPERFYQEADILVTATNKPRHITGDMIKPGAVVIDAGNFPFGAGRCGNVVFEEAVEVASAITPNPGGVGPMTVAMILRATVDAAKKQAGIAFSDPVLHSV